MRTLRIISLCLLVLVLCAAYGGARTAAGQGQSTAFGAPAQQPAAAPEPASACGGQSLCVENDELAAVVTSFRTSQLGVYKVLDVSIRFLNKTNQPLGLAYVPNSGVATDEGGNRYIVYGNNPFRGIGAVYGNNFDPKLTVRPGGFGDAQFELMWRPSGREVIGSTFVLNLTVARRAIEGNMYTVAEFPMYFQGLANGMGAAAPAYAPAGGQAAGGAAPAYAPAAAAMPAGSADASSLPPGCTPTQTDSIANAATAITNLRSMFKRKNQAAATTANASSPCPPGSTPTDAPAAAAPGAGAPAAAPATTAAPGAGAFAAPSAAPPAGGVASAPAMKGAPAASPAMRANAPGAAGAPAGGPPNQMGRPGAVNPQAGRGGLPAGAPMNQQARGAAANAQSARGQVQQPQTSAAPQPGRPAAAPATVRPQVLGAAAQTGRPASAQAAAAKPQAPTGPAAKGAKAPAKKPSDAAEKGK